MTAYLALTRRNVKLFFKDKGMFFTALVTPLILLVLYATFLGKVYRSNFAASLPTGLPGMEKLLDGCVSGQLISSLLAVSCVTVAFCSNMLMVQDKVRGTLRDLTVAPVRRSALALGYYSATLLSTLLVCFTASVVCLLYVAAMGWYLSVGDVLLLLLDVFLLSMFGTALSSFVNFFLSTQGQISAVGTVVSAGYGFLCGAYMPISQFSSALRKAVSLLPGTYGTSLLRNHALRGAFAEMTRLGFPPEGVDALRRLVDCRIELFGRQVSTAGMYLILGGATALFIALYVLLHVLRARRQAKPAAPHRRGA